MYIYGNMIMELMNMYRQKAEMVEKMLKGPVTEDIPASVLQLHPNCEFLLDADAARYVKDMV